MHTFFLVLFLLYFSSLSTTIKIHTADEQIIEYAGKKEQALLQAHTIKNMTSDIGEDETVIILPEISKKTLENVMQCLELLHQIPHLAEENKSQKEQTLHEILKATNADELYDIINASSYLTIPSLLDLSCMVWCEKYALTCFENNCHQFDNREINEALKDNCLPALQTYFINQYIKHYYPQSKILTGHERCVKSICFSPDATKIVSGSGDFTLRIWNTNTGKCSKILKGHDGAVSSVRYSFDGTKIASSSYDHTVRIWDALTGNCLHELQGHKGMVFHVCFNSDDTRIASCSMDCEIRIWDTAIGKCTHTLQGHKLWVRAVCFSRDNKTLLSGSDDGTVRLWDTTSGDCLHKFRGNQQGVVFVGYSSDNKKIVSYGNNNVRIWDITSNKCNPTLRNSHNMIMTLYVNLDPQKRISAHNVIRLWHSIAGFNYNCFTLGDESTKLAFNHGNKIHIWDISGPVKNFSKYSYEQLLFYALCKEKIENNKNFEIKDNPYFLKIFNSFPLCEQDFLQYVASLNLPLSKKILLQLCKKQSAISELFP